MSTRAAWQKLQIFKNPRWRTAAILKIVKSPYLSQKSSNFDEIWYTTSDIEPDYSHVTKIWTFKIQDGGRRHLENRFFGHNSSTDCPISAKFCMRKQNGMSTRAEWQNLQIFKIQDGGQPLFWESLNRHMSVKNRPILMKFGTYSKCCSHMTKNWNFLKFKMAAAAILKIAFFGHNLSTDSLNSAKFGTRKQTACRQRPHDKNCKFLKSKMADGRHFENR